MELDIVTPFCDLRIRFLEGSPRTAHARENFYKKCSPQAVFFENVHDPWRAIVLRSNFSEDREFRVYGLKAGVLPSPAQGTLRVYRDKNLKHGCMQQEARAPRP